MTIDQVRLLLEAQCRKAGSQTAWAAANGISLSHVSNVINGRDLPGDKVLDALGLERLPTMYRRKPHAP